MCSIPEVSWGRKWQPTPIFLLGKSHGQTSLMGYSRCDVGHKIVMNYTKWYSSLWSMAFFILPNSLKLVKAIKKNLPPITNFWWIKEHYETYQQVSSDQNTAWPWSKFPHDNISFFLVHVTMLQSNKPINSRITNQISNLNFINMYETERPWLLLEHSRQV